MKTRAGIALIVAVLLLAIVSAPMLADALYLGVVQVTNSGNTTITDGVVTFSCNSSSLIANAMASSNMTDISVTYNGLQVPFMPGYGSNPWCTYVDTITPTSFNYFLNTKGATGGNLAYFPGAVGANVTDAAALEPGNNCRFDFTVPVTSTSYNITSKLAALQILNTGTGVIGVSIPSSYSMNYSAVSTQLTTIPDSNNLSFTSGGGVDLPFSGSAWVRPNGTAATYGIMGKGTGAGDQREWKLQLISGNGSLDLFLENTAETQYIRAWSPALADSGSWHYYAFTYDGSKTVAGIKLYRDGVLLSTQATISGYVGMTAGTSAMTVGSGQTDGVYFNGMIGRVELYSVVLTATQIVTDYYSAYTSNYVARYNLNEGVGSPLDSSGNAHNASANTGTYTLLNPYMANILSLNVGIGTVATGYFIQDGVHAWLNINGLSSSNTTAVSITDVADNWIWGAGAPYISGMRHYVAGVLKGSWDWQYALTFTDLTGNGNTMTPSFRTTGTSANLTATLTSFSPASDSELGSFSFSGDLPDIGVPDTPGQMYTEGGYSHVPGADAANEMLAAGGIPYSLWWYPLIYFSVCIIGFIVYGATQGPMQGGASSNPFDGSLLTMAVVMEGLIVVFGIMNPVPLWPAYLFPIPAIALIISRKHLSWG